MHSREEEKNGLKKMVMSISFFSIRLHQVVRDCLDTLVQAAPAR